MSGGKLPPLDEEAAVASSGRGRRKRAAPTATETAERFGCELAKCGCVVVTGLAQGNGYLRGSLGRFGEKRDSVGVGSATASTRGTPRGK